jgi:hypothetical protein
MQWLKPQPPILPQTAVSKCRPTEQLCKLPENFVALTLEQQASVALACHTVNTLEYAKCDLRHLALIDWAKTVAKTDGK